MPIRKIENPVSISGRVGEIRAPIPPYVPNILRRFWERTRKLANAFSKNLLKNREEEFLKVVAKDFEEKGRHS